MRLKSLHWRPEFHNWSPADDELFHAMIITQTITLHGFQTNRLKGKGKGKGKRYLARVADKIKFKAVRQSVTSFLPFRCF